MLGGATVDKDARTSLDGLLAAGEATSSGLHGANRLASNSLLEAVVYGERAGITASHAVANMDDRLQAMSIENRTVADPAGELLNLVDIRNSLASLMWRSVGVRRLPEKMEDALNSIEQWCHYVLPRQFSDPQGWELQNMLVVARLVIVAALQREESRGVHLRSDFPDQDDTNWRRHLTIRRDSEA